MLVIGSTALARALSLRGYKLPRVPADLDVICTEKEMRQYAAEKDLVLAKMADYKWQGKPRVRGARPDAPKFVEFELLGKSESGYDYTAWTINAMEAREMSDFFWKDIHNESYLIYAPLPVLYSIKLAHRHYPRAWKKHAEDRNLMSFILGGVDSMPEITAVREKETEEREGKLKTPSLNKTAEDFFNDKVSNKIFIHDEIHAVMAHREKPMFEYFKKDGALPGSVACSRAKFEALPLEARIQAVLEEAYVIALERMMIPMLFRGGKFYGADQAFDWALMRICTTLCSGWFREFATMNYGQIMAFKNEKYVEKFLEAFEARKIQLIGEAHVQKDAELQGR